MTVINRYGQSIYEYCRAFFASMAWNDGKVPSRIVFNPKDRNKWQAEWADCSQWLEWRDGVLYIQDDGHPATKEDKTARGYPLVHVFHDGDRSVGMSGDTVAIDWRGVMQMNPSELQNFKEALRSFWSDYFDMAPKHVGVRMEDEESDDDSDLLCPHCGAELSDDEENACRSCGNGKTASFMYGRVRVYLRRWSGNTEYRSDESEPMQWTPVPHNKSKARSGFFKVLRKEANAFEDTLP